MPIEINNKTGKIEDSQVKEIVEGAVERLIEKGLINSKQIELSIAVVGTGEIQQLNKHYRKKDEPTDVLSFGYENTKEMFSGEIIICPEIIEKYSLEDGTDYFGEIKKNLVHGLLHVLGHEHGKQMFALQEDVLANL